MPAGDAAGDDAAEPTDLSGPEAVILDRDRTLVYTGRVVLTMKHQPGLFRIEIRDVHEHLLVAVTERGNPGPWWMAPEEGS